MSKVPQILQDETGYASSARVGMWVVMGFSLPMIVADTFWPGVDVPDPAYALLAGMFTILAVWAMGPRIAEYVGPQIAGVVGAVAAAKRTVPERESPDAETMVRRGSG